MDYETLCRELAALLQQETPAVTDLANAAALLFTSLPRVNWAGFYLAKGKTLYLGPFQGKPACTRIAFGKGVCGTSAQEEKTLVVDDVLSFPGHIACDPTSRSEIVVPLSSGKTLFGVLDIDSRFPARFSPEDREGLERYAAVLCEKIAGKTICL